METDRQTDTKSRGNHWMMTIFDPGEYSKFTAKEAWPTWVKRVMGQEEVCPTTGKHHWQCYLQTEQVRWSSVKHWLPTAGKIQLVNKVVAARQYTQKKDTAVADTQFDLKSDREHLALHHQLEMMARHFIENEDELNKLVESAKPTEVDKQLYWTICRAILKDNPEYAAMFANPALEKMWINTRGTWVARVREADSGGA